MGGQSVLYHRHGGVTLLHITTRLVKSAAAALVRREGKRLPPGSGDLLMQIAENSSFLRSAGIRAAKEPLVGPIQRELLSSAPKHVHELRVGRGRPRLLTAMRERICLKQARNPRSRRLQLAIYHLARRKTVTRPRARIKIVMHIHP